MEIDEKDLNKVEKDLNKGIDQLQARCCKCDKIFTQITDGKRMVDKDNKQVVVCLDCCEKYKDELRPLTTEEILNNALELILLHGIFGDSMKNY